MKLQGYIAQLLHSQNCVIVPDFGGFVANYKSAVIDELNKKIHPPSKSVLFNPLLTTNDGLLGNYISQKKQVDFPEAIQFIEDQLVNWNQKLDQGSRIEIDELGFLYKENDRVHFEQSREMNLLLQAYGLMSIDFVLFNADSRKSKAVTEKPVALKIEETRPKEQKPNKIITLVDEPIEKIDSPIVKTESDSEIEKIAPLIALNQEEEINEIELQSSVDDEVVPIKRNRTVIILKYAAAVAFVPLLFYSYWIPMETDALETSSIQLVDFNPVHQQADKLYKNRTSDFSVDEKVSIDNWEDLTENIDASIYNFELSEDFYVPILLKEDVETNVLDINESTDVAEVEIIQNIDVSNNYHVISGCFSIKSNAVNLVKELQSQGFSASILDKSGGLHRVTAGNYSSKDKANQGLEKVRSAGQSGWILKK
jgi:CCDC81-like prokaryotic HU domain 1/CCDC81-like prokaryotic HU domain 2/SPOR domain